MIKFRKITMSLENMRLLHVECPRLNCYSISLTGKVFSEKINYIINIIVKSIKIFFFKLFYYSNYLLKTIDFDFKTYIEMLNNNMYSGHSRQLCAQSIHCLSNTPEICLLFINDHCFFILTLQCKLAIKHKRNIWYLLADYLNVLI